MLKRILITGLAAGLIETGYSRDAEAAADFIAVTALNQLGLTARPLADFVARIEKETPLAGVVPSFLNTHPSGENRARDIRNLSQGVGRASLQAFVLPCILQALTDVEECVVPSPISKECLWTKADEVGAAQRRYESAAVEGFRDSRKGNAF